MNWKLGLVLGFVAGIAAGAVGAYFGALPSADAAEAHARAADERAQTCEAKFTYSTVIVEPEPAAAADSPGVNLYHGLFRLSLNSQPSTFGALSYTPVPRFIIPAQVTPRSTAVRAIYGSGPVYYWIKNGTNDQHGPFPIAADVGVR